MDIRRRRRKRMKKRFQKLISPRNDNGDSGDEEDEEDDDSNGSLQVSLHGRLMVQQSQIHSKSFSPHSSTASPPSADVQYRLTALPVCVSWRPFSWFVS